MMDPYDVMIPYRLNRRWVDSLIGLADQAEIIRWSESWHEWEVQEVGTTPLRYVPCVCPGCGYHLRVIVSRGGRPLALSEVWRDHGPWARGVNVAGLDRRDPVWSAMGEVESAWPSTMTACGVCAAVFTVSPSAWWRDPRTPTPRPSLAHRPGEPALV